MSYEIGKWYRVPAVHGCFFDRNRWWPVMGPKHEDSDLGFTAQHYHIDWRFVSDAEYLRIAKRDGRSEAHVYAYVMHESRKSAVSPFGLYAQTLSKPTLKRMKMKRALPPYPLAAVRRSWLTKLEAAYAGCKLKPGMICPHRGIPLETIPAVDGIVTCSGHGLRWRVDTGELVQG